MLSACNVAVAAVLARTCWEDAWRLMDRAVACGLAAKPLTVPAHVGVDEEDEQGQGCDPGAVEHHLMGYLVKAVDTVRKQGNRASIAAKAVIEACSWVWISG